MYRKALNRAKKLLKKSSNDKSGRSESWFLQRKIPLWWLLVVLPLALGLGALLDRVGFAPPDNDDAVKMHGELRGKGGGLTSPLLECEVFEDQGMKTLSPFKYKIEELIKSYTDAGLLQDGSVYFRDLNNGMWFGINEGVFYRPASMLKVPVMIAYFKLAESAPTTLTEKILYNGNVDLSKIQGVPPESSLVAGRSYSVDELIYDMIVLSDNNAAQLLVENIDPRFLDKVLADLDVNFNPTSLERMITTHSYSGFFRILYNASYLNHDLSERALGLLSRSKFREGIRAGLPAEQLAATKFGEWGDSADSEIVQLHEFGIVYYPGRPYLLGIMTRGKRGNDFEALIQEISRVVYESVAEQQGAGGAASSPKLISADFSR